MINVLIFLEKHPKNTADLKNLVELISEVTEEFKSVLKHKARFKCH